MTDLLTQDDLEVMAANLAMGLLDGAERADALRRQLEDPHFATRVRAWQEKTDHWLEEVEPVEPPSGTLSSIETRISLGSAGTHGSTTPSIPETSKVWRNWAMAATAASLLLAVGLGIAVNNPTRDPEDQTIAVSEGPPQTANVAQIKDEAGAPLLSALYDPGSGSLSLRLADLQQPNFGPELWIIPEDGIPRSLGFLDSERLTVTLSPELRLFL